MVFEGLAWCSTVFFGISKDLFDFMAFRGENMCSSALKQQVYNGRPDAKRSLQSRNLEEDKLDLPRLPKKWMLEAINKPLETTASWG